MDRRIVITIIVALALVSMVLIVWLQVVGFKLLLSIQTQKVGPISAQVSLSSAGAVQYNNSNLLVDYAVANYNLKNVTTLNATLNVYKRPGLTQIYLLNVSDSCKDCFDNMSSVYSSLYYYLNLYGLIENSSSFSYINMSGLQKIPYNSVVIIESGLMPSALLPNPGSGNNFNILDMLRRGDSIIYVGQNLSTSVNGNCYFIEGCTQILNSQSTVSALQNANLSFVQRNAPKSSNGFYFNDPTYQFMPSGFNYGPLTAANSYNGTLVAFANYPTTSWSNQSAMANDIAKAISTRFWIQSLASGTTDIIKPDSVGSVGVYSTDTSIQSNIVNDTVMSGSIINGTYPLLVLALSNGTSTIYKDIQMRVKYTQNTTLGVQEVVGASQVIQMKIYLGSNLTRPTSFHLQVYNQSMRYVQQILLSSFNTSAGRGVLEPTAFDLKRGYYTATLLDSNNNAYGTALFYVDNITINPVPSPIPSDYFKNGTFVFLLTSNGAPVSGVTYTVNVNNGYPESGNIMNGYLYYTLPKGAILSYGTQNFNLHMLGANYTYSAQYVREYYHIPAIYIEFAIAAIVVILLQVILKAPTRDEYYIDVPDITQTKKVSVKTEPSQIISVFDKVNFYYHWRYMPLTVEEVKAGIGSNVRYNNMPISITLQNANIILNGLVASGELVNFNEYYAPKSWIAASKHDMEYLVVFRKLRDYCVSHAILFTDLDANPDADMILTKAGIQNKVVIYSSASGMRKLQISSSNMKSTIVFVSEDARMNFMSKLYMSYGEQAEILKSGISYGYIKLIDTEDLSQLMI